MKALADQEKKLLLKKVDVDQKFKEIKAKVDDVKGSLHQLHAKVSTSLKKRENNLFN